MFCLVNNSVKTFAYHGWYNIHIHKQSSVSHDMKKISEVRGIYTIIVTEQRKNWIRVWLNKQNKY